MRPQSTLLTILALLFCYAAYAQQDSSAMHLSVDDVVVTAQRHIVSIPDERGNVSLNMDALSDMPRMGGAVDVIKLLQYTPGVAATQEGNTAMYVRGGDAGQSLILLDGAPLYSPSHLLGFFSVLNTPHLSGLTLYKSGIPASLGSSTSSITEIRTHRYVPNKFSIEGNIGLIEADGAIQLPIGERFAIFASARHSYASWLTSFIAKNATIGYEFGDYGIGFTADLGRAGRLTFNSHFNNDDARANVFTYNSYCDLNWWNALGTLRLDSNIGERVEMSNMLYGSIYDNLLRPNIANKIYSVTAGVQDIGYRHNTTIDLTSATLSVGLDYAYRRVRPQHIATTESEASSMESSSEAAIYASLRWLLHQHLIIDAGVRLSLFDNGRLWCYPEPRVALEVPVTSSLKFWASYNLMTQYLHLAPQSNMSFATDFYITSSEQIPPQLSHNLSLGYSEQVLDGRLRWSAELYYRYMLNVVEYDSRILDVLMGSSDHLTMLHSGRGESYGIETSIAYGDCKCDIQLNYTLSKSVRQFDAINSGNPFPANSDRRHNLSLLATYRPTPRWTLSATFAYATGMPYTATESLYISGNAFLREYGPYNGGNLPDLHHLDISATYWFKSRRLERNGINISIYNVYARRNPVMVSWDVERNDDNTINIKERRHVIYTIVPSISWTFKF